MRVRNINKKYLLITLSALPIVPITSLPVNNDISLNYENSYLLSPRNIDVKFVPINNNYYPYSNNLDNSIKLGYSNKFETKELLFKPNIFVINSDSNNINNILIKNSIHNSNGIYNLTETPYYDFVNANISINNGYYNVSPSDYLRTYNIKLKCGKRHEIKSYGNCRFPSNSLNHIHTRSCIKYSYRDCIGCIDSTETINSSKKFNSYEYNKFLRMNSINISEYDLGNLIKINFENSLNSFDKIILAFDINYEYLKSIIMKSFNYSYATHFYKTTWINDENVKNLLAIAIAQNRLTPYFESIPKYFNYNNISYNRENDLMYWIENFEHFSYNDMKRMIESLPKLDFDKLNNVSIKDEFIGYKLFEILNNNDYLKSLVFEINYQLGETGNVKKHKVNLFELKNNINNKIIYDFKENLNSINVNEQIIKIKNVNLLIENQNKISSFSYNSGFVNHENHLIKPSETSSNSHYKFTKKTNYANLININKIDNEKSKSFLIENNILGFPTKNVNDLTAFHLMDLNTFISFKDESLQSVENINFSLLNSKYKKFIKSFKLTPYDSLGIMNVNINFVDETSINYNVVGFDIKTQFNIEKVNKEIDFSKHNFENIKEINQKYFIDNFISFSDLHNEKSLFNIDVTKNDFIENIFSDLKFTFNNDLLIFSLFIKENGIVNQHDVIVKNINKNNENIDQTIKPDELPKPDNNQNDNNNNLGNDSGIQIPSENSEQSTKSEWNDNYSWIIALGVFMVLLAITIPTSITIINKRKSKRKVISN